MSLLEDLKNVITLKNFFVNNKELTEPIAENLSSYILKFLEGKNFTHIFSPSTTFGKNLSPKISAELDVQPLSDIINVIDDKTFERPIYAGNAIATVRSNDSTKVVTVRATCFEQPFGIKC